MADLRTSHRAVEVPHPRSSTTSAPHPYRFETSLPKSAAIQRLPTPVASDYYHYPTYPPKRTVHKSRSDDEYEDKSIATYLWNKLDFSSWTG